MSVYRDEPCAFCELAARGHCLRCQLPVCTAHAPSAGAPHCAVCAKELKDDVDVVRFAFAVREESPRSWGRLNRPLSEGLIRLLESAQLVWKERQTRRRFARRTLEDIAQWRRRAGVRVRAR
ncbi:MAG TPA: hypothetical protein VF765_18875 [Polyangiaceae bacterium]